MEKELPESEFLTVPERNGLRVFYACDTSRTRREIAVERRRRRTRVALRLTGYAAVVAVVLGAGAVSLYERTRVIDISAVAPGSKKAVLELASGRRIPLDDCSNYFCVEDKYDVPIGKYSDFITYNLPKARPESEAHTVVINKVSTPYGGEFRVELCDGTQVWLNAGSELVYPAKFNRMNRQVYLSGEAFFDVAKSEIPFFVETDEYSVRVQGTRFDVSSYPDEQNGYVVLEQGSVRVSWNGCEHHLEPGQMLSMNYQNRKANRTGVLSENYSAWTTGEFVFSNESVSSIARKLSRWYNVDFVPDDGLDTYFTGHIRRASRADEVVEILMATGDVDIIPEKGRIRIRAREGRAVR